VANGLHGFVGLDAIRATVERATEIGKGHALLLHLELADSM